MKPDPTSPRVLVPSFAVSACTTYHSSYADDLASFRALGIGGIGLWEYKLPKGRDAESVEQLAESGLTATFCFPEVPGVIYGDILFSRPRDRSARLALMKSGIRRLARFNPVAIGCIAGAPRDVDVAQARSWVVHGLREAAYVAGEVGARLALEVVRPGAGGSLVATIPQALEMIADIGLENVDVLVDTWHSWDTPTFVDDIKRHVARIAGVQISDRAADCRGPLDRALPGRGAMNLANIIRALRESGFNGWYELEIFSDDGTFGDAFPNSLWLTDPSDLLRAGRDGFADVWRASLERDDDP